MSIVRLYSSREDVILVVTYLLSSINRGPAHEHHYRVPAICCDKMAANDFFNQCAVTEFLVKNNPTADAYGQFQCVYRDTAWPPAVSGDG
jgi:hypothetical protein